MKLTPNSFLLPLVVASLGLVASCGDAERKEEDSGSRTLVPGVALLDNMEDNNTQTMADKAGYLGYWFTYDDIKDCIKETYCCDEQGTYSECTDAATAGCTGSMTPVPEAEFAMASTAALAGVPVDPAAQAEVSASKVAARMTGSGYGLWGAGMGFALNEDNPYAIPAEFNGIRFLAVAPAAGPDGMEMVVKIQDSSSNPAQGACIPRTGCVGAEGTQGCYDDFGTKVTLTNSWQIFTIPFESFTRVDNYGIWNPGLEPVAFNQAVTYQIAFQIGTSYPEFDVWIDNVGFTLAAPPAQ